MNTFLMWLGGLLIGIFVLLFAGPYFVDWNSYRGVFEEEATRLLGRRVRVGGNVNVRLLPAPYLLFEDLRIADSTGIAGAPLFKTDSFKMWLAVPPLLKGAFEANKIELDKPVLSLATDREGSGNWRTLLEAKALPFVPTGVKLDSVVINEGTILYSVEDGGELTRIEKISGELMAEALAGPYAFRGTLALNGISRDIRIATTEASTGGDFRLTARVLGGESRDDHKLDGQVQGLWTKPSINGELVSKISVADRASEGRRPLIAEVRSQLSADARSLQLDDLTISFVDFAQPQIVKGTFKAHWARRNKVEVALDSRWLDFDQLINGHKNGPESVKPDADVGEEKAAEMAVQEGKPPEDPPVPAAVPLPTARALIAELVDVVPPETDVKARLDVEQLKLGNDRVAGLVVELQRSAGPLQLSTLRAVLPGGARVNFSGQVDARDGQPAFDGDLFVGGVSAARIIRWAFGSEDVDSIISDGPFSVSGRMHLGTDRVSLKSAVAEFSGAPLRGHVIWDDKDKYVDVNVEGYELDTRWFGLGKLEMPALATVLSKSDEPTVGNAAHKAGDDDSAGALAWLDRHDRQLKLDLSAGHITDGTNSLRDVEARIKLRGRRIEIERVRLLTAEGLSAELSGALDGLGQEPAGQIDYLLSAKDRAAAWRLADLWAGEAAAPADRDRFAAFAPIRVAGRMDLAKRKPGAADFSFDGTAHGGRLRAALKLDGGVGAWTDAPVDFVLRSEAADTGHLFASLAGVRGPESSERSEGDPAKILVKASGIPKNGLLTLATIDSPRISFLFDGSTALSQEGVASVQGELQLSDQDVRPLVLLAGIKVPGGVGSIGYDGLADITWIPGRFTVVPRDVNLAGARMGGRLVFTNAGDQRPRIEGKLVADTGSLPRILSVLLSEPDAEPEATLVARADNPLLERNAQAIADSGVGDVTRSLFSDRSFDLSLVEGLTGEIEVRTGRFELAPKFALSSAGIVLSAGDGKLALNLSGSEALGGTVAARLEIEKAAAGAIGRGTLELSGVDLSRLPVGPKAAQAHVFGRGKAALRAQFEGRGLTPRGLVSVASGTGELRFEDAVISGLAPSGVREAASAALRAEVLSSEDLISAVKSAIDRGEIAIGTRTLSLTIIDGALQVAPIEVNQDNGRARILTTVDLRGLVCDIDWSVIASDLNGKRTWPPVAVNMVGSVSKLGALEPRITSDALERELAVRKMERNVQELERLRKLDEGAATRESERQRQLELESQRLEAERAAAARGGSLAGSGSSGADSAGVSGEWAASTNPAPAQSTGVPGAEGAVPTAPKPAKRKPKSFPYQIFQFD